MVPRTNLGGNSIYTLRHGSPYTEAYFSQEEDNSLQVLVPTVATPLVREKFVSNVFHFLILSKIFF